MFNNKNKNKKRVAELKKIIDNPKVKSKKKAEAQYELGEMYFEGPAGIKKDEVEAFACFKSAADMGHAGAQNNVGLMCYTGTGVDNCDLETSFEYLKKSADQGCLEAIKSFADVYQALTKEIGDDFSGVFNAEANNPKQEMANKIYAYVARRASDNVGNVPRLDCTAG